MKECCGIYQITNSVTNKSYVGQAINVFSRWYEHLYRAFAIQRVDYESPLHSAFRKYGINAFSFKILEVCNKEELNEREKHWIQKLDTVAPNGYNLLIASGLGDSHKSWRLHMYKGVCPLCGKEKSKVAKLCQSCENKTRRWEANLSRLDVAKRIYNGQRAEDFSKEFGISQKGIRKGFARLGLPTKAKDIKRWYMNEMKIQPPIVQKRTPTAPKPVIMMDKDGKEINRFPSISSAGRAIGCSGEIIRHALVRGKTHKSKGYYWKFA